MADMLPCELTMTTNTMTKPPGRPLRAEPRLHLALGTYLARHAVSKASPTW
jgi:hypothetical protein